MEKQQNHRKNEIKVLTDCLSSGSEIDISKLFSALLKDTSDSNYLSTILTYQILLTHSVDKYKSLYIGAQIALHALTYPPVRWGLFFSALSGFSGFSSKNENVIDVDKVRDAIRKFHKSKELDPKFPIYNYLQILADELQDLILLDNYLTGCAESSSPYRNISEHILKFESILDKGEESYELRKESTKIFF